MKTRTIIREKIFFMQANLNLAGAKSLSQRGYFGFLTISYRLFYEYWKSFSEIQQININ